MKPEIIETTSETAEGETVSETVMVLTGEPTLDDEEGRLRALERLDVVDTAEEGPFDRIVGLVAQVLNVPISTVSLVDRTRQWFKARRGLDVCETPREISFCTHTIRQSEPMIVRDAVEDPRFANNPLVTGPPHIRAYAGVPLTTPEGYNVGSLCAIDTKPREFPASEIAILENFAKVVVDELELRQIASVDQLSEALTRRAWLEQVGVEVRRAQRYGEPCSIAILDIDKFKAINDTYGHPAGDVVIREMAGIVLAEMRESDLFGRLGGEEFALFMPETPAQGASVFMDRIREIAEARTFEADQPIRATISVGVTELLGDQDTLETFIARGDTALYRAKTTGRNRVVLSEEGEAHAAG